MTIETFNKYHPNHWILDFIACSINRTILGRDVSYQEVKSALSLQYVVISEGLFGKELSITNKGYQSLLRSREALEEV